MQTRIPEVDLLRTIAIIMMVIYHTAFDLHVLYHWNIDLWGAGWETFRIATVSLFVLVSGIASQLSKRPIRRALIVLAAALLVSVVTFIYDSTIFIYFGILHCIGVGMLLLIPLKKLNELLIPIGLTLTLAPILFPALAPILTPPPIRPTLDYYPLIPWFGLMLIGSGIGHFLYRRNTYRSLITDHRILTIPGRHALVIYLIHQPILLGILYFIL